MRGAVLLAGYMIASAAFSQARNARWVVGDSIQVTFSTGVPVVTTQAPVITAEGQGAISDVEGNLLFVANHGALFNAQFDTMPNGHGPFSLEQFGDVTQGSLIVPLPGHPTQYMVVYIHGHSADYWPKAERMTVDIALDGGSGDVVLGSRWTFGDSLTEKLTGTPHANEVDYWVVGHEWDSNEFHAHLVNVDGLDTVPVISHAGTPHTRFINLPNYNNNHQGQMKFDLSGERLATTTQNGNSPQPGPCITQLFSFDAGNGHVEYEMTFPGHKRSYGIEFSPDGSKLYVSGYDSLYHYVDQYDLSLPDTTAIEGSRSRVYEFYHGGGFGNSNDRPLAMATAPDGRIYVTRAFAPHPWFAVIDQPNALGTACNFLWNGLDLGVGNLQASHCNQLKRYHDSDFTASVRPVAPRPGLNLWPNPMQDHAWLDGVAERGALLVLWRDASGRSVHQEQVYGNRFGVLLTTGELCDGVYAMELLHNGQRLGVVRAVVRR